MDPEPFKVNPVSLRNPSGKLRIGYLGSLIPSKGVHLLIEACLKLPADKFTFDIYGAAIPYDGFPNYEKELHQKAAPFSQVKFHGKYANQDIAKILSALDVVVVPSLWQENAPLTIEEAFLAKVPVVAARWGGMQERLAGDGGMLFIPGQVDSLAETLQYLIDHPEHLRTLRDSVPKVPSAAEMTPVWEEVYQELLAVK